MTCQDAIVLMGEFLEQTLAREVVEALEAHLADCAPCRAYLGTYRATRALVGEAGRVEMPEDLRARLRQFLLEQLGR